MSKKAKRNITFALLLAFVGLFSLVGRTPAQGSSLTFMVLGDTRSGHEAHQAEPPGTIRVPQDQPTIQAGINAAQDGDLVLVSPGTYTEQLILSGKTITLASQFHTTGDQNLIDQTIIDGNGQTVITVNESVGPETKIIGFTIKNGNDGIKPYAKLHILNNRFTGHSDAIDYEGGGGICRNNVFENNSDDAIDLDGPTEVIIEDNTIRNNGDDGIEVRLHSYSGPTLNIIIRNNIISGNDEDGIQLIDYSDVSDRVFLIERNLIKDSAMAGLGLMDNGDTTEDFRAASIPERIHLFNNTFIDNDHGVTGGDNLIALNNLFVNSTNIALKEVNGNSIAAYNLFWNNGTDSQGSNIDNNTSLFADPRLDSDHQLQTGSPAIDAGTAYFEWQGETVLDLPSSAYSGTAPDLGMFESNFTPPATLTPTPSPTPTPTPSRTPTPGGPEVYEAENASLTEAEVSTGHLGFTGSGFVNFLADSGASIKWTNVNVPSSGNYTLVFRYALGKTGDRPIEIKVNGNIVESSLNFPNTGGWSNWRTLDITTSLNSGTNTIEAVTIGYDGPNIDHLEVQPSEGPSVQTQIFLPFVSKSSLP